MLRPVELAGVIAAARVLENEIQALLDAKQAGSTAEAVVGQAEEAVAQGRFDEARRLLELESK